MSKSIKIFNRKKKTLAKSRQENVQITKLHLNHKSAKSVKSAEIVN